MHLMGVGVKDNPTVDGFALRQVAVILASEQAISISSHNALDIPKTYQQSERPDSLLSRRYLPAVHIEK